MDRKGLFYLLGLLLMVVWAPPGLGAAADTELENALQGNLQESRDLLARVRAKLRAREGISADLFRLKSVAEEIRISDLLLQERFALREEKLQELGAKVEVRHRAMTEGYRKALQDYLNLVASLPAGDEVSSALLEDLQILLDKIIPKKRRPILGSLPYRNLQYPLKDPNANPPITPAYLGGNRAVVPEDLKDPSSKAISSLAQSLNWNPVSIYEWVKNNVETERYFGCMKGAEETLRQKSGNDCDQAALLVALLRASGFPSRYVRGVIEFFPDITQAKNLTGIDDENELASFFQKAGIPFRPIIAGGKIANFQIEHIWVESQIPYSNYRGAVLDEQGKSWIALDTSIKAAGYDSNSPADLPPEPFFSEIRDQYLGALRPETPLEFIQSKLEAYLSQAQPGKHYADLLRRRTLLPEVLNILPSGLQFRPIKITQEYSEIPEALVHRVRMIASGCGLRVGGCGEDQALFNITLPAAQLSNQKVVLTYEPESVEDQQTIDAYGGLDNTPAYLVRLRPVLKVNEERIIVAQDGLPMGEDYTLTVEMISPNGVETFTTHPIIGNLSVLGIVSQKAILNAQPATRDTQPDASQLLYEAALHYADRWGRAEDELASLMRRSISRPIPSLVIVGGVINVTYLLDTPHGFEWKGVFVDAAVRGIETVACCGLRVGELGSERVKTFMQLSSLQGSILENRIFEDDFKVESISAAKLFTLVNSQPATRNILTLDHSNIDTSLPLLPFTDEIKEDLTNAVNQGWIVRIPSSEITYRDWSGIGYLKEDPETGEAGWMLSGEIAGGESVEAPSNWDVTELMNRLSRPYSGEVNDNSRGAAAIVKVSSTDKKTGVVGVPLTHPLGAYVRDKNMKPVVGALVTFQIVAGGGALINPGNSEMVQSIEVVTDRSGIAVASLVLGQKTSNNPTYMKLDTADRYMTQVGLNLVTATVESDAGTIPLEAPFIAYGNPDLPHHLLKAFPEEGRTVTALVNNPAGSLRVVLADQYDNPISNQALTFEALNPVSQDPTVSPLPSGARKVTFYLSEDCPDPYPLYSPNHVNLGCRPQETLSRTTQYFGAIVNTLIGNTVYTKHTVRASSEVQGVSPVEFTLYSDGFRGAGEYIPATPYINSLGIVDDQGRPVNATKVGKPLAAPLTSKVFLLYDEYTLVDSHGCPYDTARICWNIQPTGIVEIKPISNADLLYTFVRGGGELGQTENLGDGKYQSGYTAGVIADINQIQAVAEANVTVPLIYVNLSTGHTDPNHYEATGNPPRLQEVTAEKIRSGQRAWFDRETGQRVPDSILGTRYTIYGVDLQLTVDPSVVVLNDEGRITRNVTFRYTILPGEYEPSLVMIELYRGTSRPNIPGEGWDGYILGDKGTLVTVGNGTERRGSAVLSAGSPFDITFFYAAEATLNRGTVVEIRSGTESVVGGVRQVRRTDLPIAKILVKSEVMAGISPSGVDQIRFGNGAHPAKTYRIELRSRVLVELCENLTGMLRVINKNGVLIAPPDSSQNIHYPLASYPLEFANQNGQCLVRIQDPTALRDRFVLSNLSQEAFGISDKAVLYGGLGNQVEVDINGAKKETPIEPVGVIVIGIDGLRQDVLYNSTEASHLDSIGCGGSPCYVDSATLSGFSQILTEAGTIKLRDVTAVFPSITLASWASIFTGKMPNETGILGNEFFARDIDFSVPSRYGHPPGIVSFGSGAFWGYDAFVYDSLLGPAGLLGSDFLVPVQIGWSTSVESIRGPQNDPRILNIEAKTVYESINEMAGLRSSFVEKGGDASVVAYSHYARGSHWLTWDPGAIIDYPNVLDNGSWDKLEEYLEGKYQTFFLRNDVPFSALTTWYLSGLDHQAHEEGMGAYRDYFIDVTDKYVRNLVDQLRELNEFDNKIFLITADHGATAMPEFGSVPFPDGRTVQPDTSCELKVTGFDDINTQDSERTNNNLHIWELAEVMKSIGEDGWEVYKILAPPEIAKLYTQGEEEQSITLPYGATDSLNRANVIAALNGPMAHVYLRNQTGWQTPNTDIAALARLAVFLKAYLMEGGADLKKADQDKFRRLLSSVDFILIREGGEYKKFRGAQVDQAGNIIGADTEPIGENTFDRFQYIQALDRIKGLNHPNRSGDLVLVLKDFAGGSPLERYTSGVPCKAWHGSLNPTDSYVPFIVAYPGGNKQVLENIINQEGICPAGVCEGNWKASDLILELVRRQYLKN